MRFWEFFLALRYLRDRKRQKFISFISLTSVLGVCIGVCTLIIVISVMNGFDDVLVKKFIGMDAHLSVEKYGTSLTEKECDLVFQRFPEIKAWSPQLLGESLIRSSSKSSGVFIRGVDWTKELKTSFINNNLVFQKPQDLLREKDGIVIGKTLARSLGVSIGDSLELISPAQLMKKRRKLEVKTFEVVDIFETSLYEFDSTQVYIGLNSFRNLFDKTDLAVNKINILLESNDVLREVQKKLQLFLGERFLVYSWYERNRNLFSALKLEKNVMFIILSLIIIVSVFNIASTLIMTIMEKMRDIGILKALGAQNYSIALIFSLQGGIIGCVGSFLGTVLGLGICFVLKKTTWIRLPSEIYSVDHLPVLVDFGDVVLIFFSAIVLALLSTIYPSLFAFRLKPLHALSL